MINECYAELLQKTPPPVTLKLMRAPELTKAEIAKSFGILVLWTNQGIGKRIRD